MEDAAIVELFFARSERAIQALDEKYGGACQALAYGILGDRRDAEECVNDAWLGVWNAIPPARPAPLRAYVCKVVRNLSLKRYYHGKAAKRGGAYTVAMQELEPCLAAPGGVEAELEARELARSIEAFLDALREEDRAVFLLRYWFALPYAEIAARAGLTEKAVSVRLTRLRRRLRAYLTERGMWT